ncbi:Uncharacterised protein [Yersinia frederiksenii]|nr:Uncharacterised protein [Yersinia frederiksenii]
MTIAFTSLLAIPFASALSMVMVSAPLTMVAVPLSGIKVTSTARLTPLTEAVTRVTPAVVLVSDCVIEPSAPVVPLAAIWAPLLATKLTARLGIGLPLASVTTTFTRLLTLPFASALSVSTLSAPSTMVAVPLSGIKLTATLWLELFNVAVMLVTPVAVFTAVTMIAPLVSVMPLDNESVAPLSATKLTSWLGTGLPLASVTLT